MPLHLDNSFNGKLWWWHGSRRNLATEFESLQYYRVLSYYQNLEWQEYNPHHAKDKAHYIRWRHLFDSPGGES
jgi:hypothetical protein